MKLYFCTLNVSKRLTFDFKLSVVFCFDLYCCLPYLALLDFCFAFSIVAPKLTLYFECTDMGIEFIPKSFGVLVFLKLSFFVAPSSYVSFLMCFAVLVLVDCPSFAATCSCRTVDCLHTLIFIFVKYLFVKSTLNIS